MEFVWYTWPCDKLDLKYVELRTAFNAVFYLIVLLFAELSISCKHIGLTCGSEQRGQGRLGSQMA